MVRRGLPEERKEPSREAARGAEGGGGPPVVKADRAGGRDGGHVGHL